MANSGLRGPYALDSKSISNNVTVKSPGAYALGKTNASGGLDISRIGRSDVDVGQRLGNYVGEYHDFKFGYYDSPKAAFLKECHLYHDFAPPDNDIHPDRPKGDKSKCPRCNIFD
jgi:hypothetical protein